MLDECFDNHIVVILRFYVTLLTLLPPQHWNARISLGGRRGRRVTSFQISPTIARVKASSTFGKAR